MKENYYLFLSKIILTNIDKLDINYSAKQELLNDIIKKLEAK